MDLKSGDSEIRTSTIALHPQWLKTPWPPETPLGGTEVIQNKAWDKKKCIEYGFKNANVN